MVENNGNQEIDSFSIIIHKLSTYVFVNKLSSKLRHDGYVFDRTSENIEKGTRITFHAAPEVLPEIIKIVDDNVRDNINVINASSGKKVKGIDSFSVDIKSFTLDLCDISNRLEEKFYVYDMKVSTCHGVDDPFNRVTFYAKDDELLKIKRDVTELIDAIAVKERGIERRSLTSKFRAAIRKMSQSLGLSDDRTFDNGNTILHIFAKGIDCDADSIFKHHDDPDAQNDKGETPLIVAVLNNNEYAVKMLLQYGANPDIADYSSLSASDHAEKNNQAISQLFEQHYDQMATMK